ncbi:MAG: rod-binding protein, partial [candidate division Zixibacteria bacterium]
MNEMAINSLTANIQAKTIGGNGGTKPATVEAEKTRLRKAAKDFEAFFMYQMLKTMRETVPENPLVKGSPFSNGHGKDTFTQIFDMEISKKMVGSGHESISEILYRSLEKVIEAQFKGNNREEQIKLKPLKAEDAGFKPLLQEKLELKE